MKKNNIHKDNSSFFAMVYDVARQIPCGRVTSYGAIAEYLGSKSSSRMVGWAMNQSHSQKKPVPAHRVVNRNGILTGKHHFGGSNLMKQLLENEGIKVVDDQIINFKQHFWDPNKELNF
ncbi:MAG: MGMT family protein [Bacteroidales bacterium]|jgi:methylated-DNA-protein-cysteine methyltransferase-like protein|nr:MGMT family protein [Bacteroidales bacterium]MDD4213535.1 MGMT family protein [Bacteroidales bacterium]